MKCQNCGENNANVKYTQIINGVKKELHLCQRCSEELGIGNFNMNFDMPMDLSSFFADFLGEPDTEFFPDVKQQLKCNECGETFEDFANTGRFGCGNCYNVFSDKIDAILKNIHNGNRHVGRKGIPSTTHIEKINQVVPDNKIAKLKMELKNAIKEERYEDAAKIRDEIKKIEEE